MAPVESNQGIGNHNFYPQLSTCQAAGCHVSATSFDVIGGQTDMRASLQELREALNAEGWLTRSEIAPYEALTPEQLEDAQLAEDAVRPGPQSNNLSANEAGAIYNYLLLARGSGGGVHNPLYVRQLIFDSYEAVTGGPPATIPTRPSP
jgi:hypothetical protein